MKKIQIVVSSRWQVARERGENGDEWRGKLPFSARSFAQPPFKKNKSANMCSPYNSGIADSGQ